MRRLVPGAVRSGQRHDAGRVRGGLVSGAHASATTARARTGSVAPANQARARPCFVSDAWMVRVNA